MDAPSVPSGCDPAVFADEVANYLLQAEHAKAEAVLDARAPRAKAEAEEARRHGRGVGRGGGHNRVEQLLVVGHTARSACAGGQEGRRRAGRGAAAPAVTVPDSPREAVADAATPSGPSSWDNPWDVAAPSIWKEPAAVKDTYLDDHIIPGPDPFVAAASETLEALLEQPATATAADELASTPIHHAEFVRPDPLPRSIERTLGPRRHPRRCSPSSSRRPRRSSSR